MLYHFTSLIYFPFLQHCSFHTRSKRMREGDIPLCFYFTFTFVFFLISILSSPKFWVHGLAQKISQHLNQTNSTQTQSSKLEFEILKLMTVQSEISLVRPHCGKQKQQGGRGDLKEDRRKLFKNLFSRTKN
ncbi:hypothetical protein CROQUDRAFT_494422 [Cronartium quercuum f. sp. fusiforme G11]|uniref:Transmembrane protein n=1 Tax=Cronartium quercuum f. sp. fusiforme G11 TaxID=708437 RepID=A0A9P6NH86_9BASI|nr:hypothetical protein CROQUDRAFT_494422 [Cronartium quercuum f. sp. fusiforme G11]